MEKSKTIEDQENCLEGLISFIFTILTIEIGVLGSLILAILSSMILTSKFIVSLLVGKLENDFSFNFYATYLH